MNPTTVKKSATVILPILASIPFHLGSMPDFDTETTHIVKSWLGALSVNAEIRLMLIANEIKTYDDFKCLDQESIFLLERVTNIGAITRFSNFQAKKVNDVRGYISFMENSGDTTLADDQNTWVKGDFEKWKRKGKSSGLNVSIVTNVSNTGPPATKAGEKLQKANDNKLQS